MSHPYHAGFTYVVGNTDGGIRDAQRQIDSETDRQTDRLTERKRNYVACIRCALVYRCLAYIYHAFQLVNCFLGFLHLHFRHFSRLLPSLRSHALGAIHFHPLSVLDPCVSASVYQAVRP